LKQDAKQTTCRKYAAKQKFEEGALAQKWDKSDFILELPNWQELHIADSCLIKNLVALTLNAD
jgi:hypothetical protein